MHDWNVAGTSSITMNSLPELINDQKQVDDLCRNWRKAGAFAFDTEFIRDDTFETNLCLIQVACDGEVALLDPTARIDVSEFWRLVCDPAILKIVHAGKEDFDVCVTACGQVPRSVFDAQLAAGFVGFGYPLSLTRLAAATVGKRISKGATLTDWSRRPLTDDQVRYAIDDVAYLPAICRHLQDLLEKRGRADWAREEFRRFEQIELYATPPEERLQRMKGSRSLDGLGLLVLEKLIEWREAWAREKNRPMRAMMRDDILVEIAKRRPSRASQLEVMRGFPQARNPRIIEQILAIIAQSKEVPVEQRPKPAEMKEEPAITRVLVDLLGAALRATCIAEEIDPDIVATNQRLRDLLDHLESPKEKPPQLLTGWRRTFIGERLLDVLEGRTEIHLAGWPQKTELRFAKRATSPLQKDS